jgi:L-rhamnose mutarotase
MFHHFEYVGEDFANDMKKLDNDPTIKFWWTQ